jgi:hypothetical protein
MNPTQFEASGNFASRCYIQIEDPDGNDLIDPFFIR